MKRKFHVRVATAAVLVLASLGVSSAMLIFAPLPGAIFTSENCDGVDRNIYNSKDDVTLNGGPSHPGAAGLPDGYYYVQVTAPSGTLLGTSVGSGNPTPVHVTSGEFDACLYLSSILIKASDGTAGYDDTPNAGGEYKVWVSTVPTFDNDSTKTDNFKVKKSETPNPPDPARLQVQKYYDKNVNGLFDTGEQLIDGWKVNITDGLNIDRYTPVDIILDPDAYTISEYMPVQVNWYATGREYENGAASGTFSGAGSVNLTLAIGDDATAKFGNVCTGAGGGLTLGFWSNNNGQKIVTGSTTGNTLLAADQNLLRGLNLRNANGTYLYTGTTTAPVAQNITYATFRTWLLGANASNMANMLSAQLAAMELNVLNGKVNGSSLIYAPGATSANSLGFATVSAVMAEAVASLGANGYTVASGTVRTYQEALKNALDKANNNQNFVQSTPCAFTFSQP